MVVAAIEGVSPSSVCVLSPFHMFIQNSYMNDIITGKRPSFFSSPLLILLSIPFER